MLRGVSEVTRILSQIEQGDPQAAELLLPLVYEELRKLASEGKNWIARYQAQEITRTAIASLKVGYNEIDGYYLEVTNANTNRVPENYKHKKTLKNAIAYIKRLHQVRSGGFGYQHASDPPGFARSAAGICVLQLSGAYEAREIPKAVSFLKQHFGDGHYFWYGHYYAAHAMHLLILPAKQPANRGPEPFHLLIDAVSFRESGDFDCRHEQIVWGLGTGG